MDLFEALRGILQSSPREVHKTPRGTLGSKHKVSYRGALQRTHRGDSLYDLQKDPQNSFVKHIQRDMQKAP